MSDDLEAEIDQLFQAPRESFTKTRDALVKRLRAAKDSEAALRVKSLTKPTASAWAINRVWWTARPELDALLDAAEHVRQAQARGDLERMRAAERERRRQHQALLDRVGAWVGGNAAVLRKVAVNLDALAAHGRARLPGVPGRWSEDLEAPGFDLLAPAIGLVPPLAEVPPPSDGGEATGAEQAKRAAEARRVAEQRVDDAERRYTQAERAVATAREAHQAALANHAEAEEAVRRARLAAERAVEQRHAAEAELERTDGLLTEVRREVEAARAALGELDD